MDNIAIISYGAGNITSVANALQLLGAHFHVATTYKTLKQANSFILPGVGAFPSAISNLRQSGIADTLDDYVLVEEKPFLGICLGMQLIAKDSLEIGHSVGLGWIDGHVVKLQPTDGLSLPHVGWNEVNYKPHSILFDHIEQNSHFFFDHSFHLQCDQRIVTSTCDYGGRWITSIRQKNILATQFHPEKSQRSGLKLLRNFVNFVNGCD